MSTKKNGVTSTSKKSVSKRVNNAASAASVNVTKDQIERVTAAAVAGSASSSERARGLAAGASVVSLPAGRASVVASAVMDQDTKVIDLRTKIASRWAAPRFEDSKEYTIMSAALAAVPADLRERSLNGARLVWLARPENAASCPTVGEVCEYINANFASEFRNVCGCSVPAASAVRVYSYTNMSVSTITADSDVNDYLYSAPVPSGLSAAGVVAAVMSIRVLADIRRRFAAARAAARNQFKDSMCLCARSASRLGISSAVAARYFSYLLNAVPAADASEEKRLRTNLSRCWASLRACENSIVLAAPAGAFGAIEDQCGGWCFPASLPASAPAKVRKLWAKRVGLLSSISTLETLLSRC